MVAEKTIHICGKEVAMRYCAAAETGYEMISGQSSDVFVPDVKHDKEGNVVDFKMNASTEDFIKLAVAAIVAAYERRGEEVPIGTDEILYDADPSEVKLLINTVMELRLRWYAVPKTVVESEFEPAADAADTAAKKNVDAPASDSKGS